MVFMLAIQIELVSISNMFINFRGGLINSFPLKGFTGFFRLILRFFTKPCLFEELAYIAYRPLLGLGWLSGFACSYLTPPARPILFHLPAHHDQSYRTPPWRPVPFLQKMASPNKWRRRWLHSQPIQGQQAGTILRCLSRKQREKIYGFDNFTAAVHFCMCDNHTERIFWAFLRYYLFTVFLAVRGIFFVNPLRIFTGFFRSLKLFVQVRAYSRLGR